MTKTWKVGIVVIVVAIVVGGGIFLWPNTKQPNQAPPTPVTPITSPQNTKVAGEFYYYTAVAPDEYKTTAQGKICFIPAQLDTVNNGNMFCFTNTAEAFAGLGIKLEEGCNAYSGTATVEIQNLTETVTSTLKSDACFAKGECSFNEAQYIKTVVMTAPPTCSMASAKDVDGKYIGYITDVSFSGGEYSLNFDYIQWVSCDGKGAVYCPNAFNIIDSDPSFRKYSISDKAVIKMATFSHQKTGVDKGSFTQDEIISLKTFVGVVNGTIVPPSLLDSGMEIKSYTSSYNTVSTTQPGIPFWIVLKNGTITEIAEQYLP